MTAPRGKGQHEQGFGQRGLGIQLPWQPNTIYPFDFGHEQPQIVLVGNGIQRAPHLTWNFKTFSLWRKVFLLDHENDVAAKDMRAALIRVNDANFSITRVDREIDDLAKIERLRGSSPELKLIRARAEEKKSQHELAKRLAEEAVQNLLQRARDIKRQREQLIQDALVPLERAFYELGVLPDAKNDLPARVKVLDTSKNSGPPPFAEVSKDSTSSSDRLNTHTQSQQWPENTWNCDDARPIDWMPNTKLMHQLLKVTLDSPESTWNNADGEELLYAAYRLQALISERDRAYTIYCDTEKVFDRHRDSYSSELLKFIPRNKHRANAAALETEFGGIWLTRTQEITRRYEAALGSYTSVERDVERAKASERAAKLLAVRLEPLHRHPHGSFDLTGRRAGDDRKRKRVVEWLDADRVQAFPLQEPPWDARSAASSAEGWSKLAEGACRRRINELDEFCGRVGERRNDEEGIRPLY